MAESMEITVGAADNLRGQIVPDGTGGLIEPFEIMSSIHAARAFYYKVRQEHLKRINTMSQIEGMISGNPPYNPYELKKLGLSHIANFNTMEPRSLYKRTALCFWNLINEAESLITFELKYPGMRGRSPELVKWQDIMAKNWTELVKENWSSFIVQMSTLTAQLVKFGVSPIVFHDERDWRWRTVEYSKFFVPDQTQCDLELLTSVAIESNFTVQYLFDVYKNEVNKKNKKSPWNLNEIKNLLLHIANSYIKSTYTDYIDMFELQRRYENGDINLDAMFSDSVRLISIYYLEYDKTISHYMFHRVYDSGECIFQLPHQYKLGMFEAINIFTSSPGEWTIHSNRGLGHEFFSIMQAVMQNDCSVMDMCKWASTPMLKTTAVGNADLQAIRFTPGAPVVLGQAEWQQNNLGANITQVVSASQYLSAKALTNTANSGEDPSMPDADQGSISAVQAKMRSWKEFNVLKNIVAHFYSQLDPVYRNMVAKMLASKPGYPGYETAYEWKQRCIEDGVPKEIFDYNPPESFLLPRHIRAKATRVAGDGSTLARLMGLEAISPYMAASGPKQQREFMRQLVTAAMGADQVNAFVRPEEESDETSGGASLAALENNSMQNGQSPLFSMENEQRAHFATHMALATHTIQSIAMQKLDPIVADKVFTVLVPHLAEHFEALKKSPFDQSFIEQNKKNFGQVVEYSKLNRGKAEAMLQAQVRRQQEQEAAAQQTMGDEARKNMAAQGDKARADFKVQSQVQRAKDANQTRAEIAREKVQKDAENQKLKIQLDHSNKMSENANADAETMLADMVGEKPNPSSIATPTGETIL